MHPGSAPVEDDQYLVESVTLSDSNFKRACKSGIRCPSLVAMLNSRSMLCRETVICMYILVALSDRNFKRACESGIRHPSLVAMFINSRIMLWRATVIFHYMHGRYSKGCRWHGLTEGAHFLKRHLLCPRPGQANTWPETNSLVISYMISYMIS
jgi:hypothetical protein